MIHAFLDTREEERQQILSQSYYAHHPTTYSQYTNSYSNNQILRPRRTSNHFTPQYQTENFNPTKRMKNTTSLPDYLAILDFEATCEDSMINDTWIHEIIEFPVVFLNVKTLQKEFEFHRYVHPVETEVLTMFCHQLTGIHQEWVEDAPVLPQVLAEFEEFCERRSLVHAPVVKSPAGKLEVRAVRGKKTFVFATDGPWDFQNFLLPECTRKGLVYPISTRFFVNVRNWFGTKVNNGRRTNIQNMLKFFQLKFEGRAHSGIEDARNITRICIKLLELNALPDIESVPLQPYRRNRNQMRPVQYQTANRV